MRRSVTLFWKSDSRLASPDLQPIQVEIPFANEVTGKQFKVLGKNRVTGRTLASPAFDEGTLYLRTDEHLYKYARQ